jgi:hypothetical protein
MVRARGMGKIREKSKSKSFIRQFSDGKKSKGLERRSEGKRINKINSDIGNRPPI